MLVELVAEVLLPCEVAVEKCYKMLLFLLILLATLAYSWVSRRYTYWQRRKVSYVEPSFPMGNMSGMNTRHLAFLAQDWYKQLKSSGKKFGGVFFFVKPVALVLDLDFLKDVFVKDFQSFHDRGMYSNEKVDPIMSHLVSMEGVKWKNLRSKLTPTFTSGKMKMMFPAVTSVAEELRKHLELETEQPAEIEMKDILARFTTDVIGNCAFGLNCNSLKDPEAEFRVMGRKALSSTPITLLRRMLSFNFRSVCKVLGMRITDPKVASFFMNAVRETIDYREKNNHHRNDFMDLLIKLKNDESIGEGNSEQQGRLTFNEIAAQSFVFFLAGFETSSTAMSYCLYELAQNQDLQDRARQNVEDVLVQHGSMTYEAVHEMKFIEKCINESLRKYPPLPNIIRDITKDYHVSDMNVTLEKGYRVLIPIYAIHHDPEYYPEPDAYNPDRFDPEVTEKRHPMAFIPFGEGPRICIALRFGMMQARVGLAYLLKHFRFTLSPKTESPPKIVATSAVLASEGGLWLHVEKITPK